MGRIGYRESSGCIFLLKICKLQIMGWGRTSISQAAPANLSDFPTAPNHTYFPNTAHPPSTSHPAAQNRGAKPAQIWPEVQPGQACAVCTFSKATQWVRRGWKTKASDDYVVMMRTRQITATLIKRNKSLHIGHPYHPDDNHAPQFDENPKILTTMLLRWELVQIASCHCTPLNPFYAPPMIITLSRWRWRW